MVGPLNVHTCGVDDAGDDVDVDVDDYEDDNDGCGTGWQLCAQKFLMICSSFN